MEKITLDVRLPQDVCGQCGKTDQKLSDCACCQLARYCSLQCQEDNWRQHQPICHLVLPQIIKQIARGGEGIIHLANWRGEQVVVKAPLDLQAPSLAKEMHVLKNITHSHVLNCLGVIPSKRWLLFPYMEKGSLKDILSEKTKEPFLWLQRLQVSCDTAEGLQCLHSHGILHCDIKSDNILLNSAYRAKLADFGTVQIASRPELKYPWGGSLAYWAPELLPWIQRLPASSIAQFFGKQNQPLKGALPPFSESSDIYALGTLFWEIAERYSAPSEIQYNLGQFKCSPETPSIYRTWIERCRTKEAVKRPLASAIFRAFSTQATREKLLGEADQRLALTRIVLKEELPPVDALLTALSQLPFLDQYLFPLKKLESHLLTQEQEKLQKQLDLLASDFLLLQTSTSLNTLESWQLNCDCLLKNQTYLAQMTPDQRRFLQQLVCCYGHWAPELARSHWEALEEHILHENSFWKKEALQPWLLGFAEIRMYRGAKDSLQESIGFLQMNRQLGPYQAHEARLHYAETVIHLSLLWKTLHATLKTETECRFYEVAKHWFRLLRESKEQFSTSNDPFVKTSLPTLLSNSAQCMESLIPRIHKRFVLLLKDAQMSSSQALAHLVESDLVDWIHNYEIFEKWEWITALHHDVLKPTLEPYLQAAQQIGGKEFAEAVTKWIEPWLQRYHATGQLNTLIQLSGDWIRTLSIAKESKAQEFDTIGFKERICQKREFPLPLLTGPKNPPLWQALNHQREKPYKNPAKYTKQVIATLEKALQTCLPFLGEAPKGTRWALLGLGSLGRGQLLPYSDLDIALLVEEEEVREHPYWQRMIHLFETLTQMMDSVGYWDPSTSRYIFLGHHIDASDKQVMQGEKPLLIQTPRGFANWVVKTLHSVVEQDEKTGQKTVAQRLLAYSCLHPIMLTDKGTDLLASYHFELTKALKQNIKHPAMGSAWQQEHGRDWQRSLRDDLLVKKNYINVKDSVFAPLNHYWLDNGLLHLLGQKGLFTDIDLLKKELKKKDHSPYWLKVIHTAWEEAFQLRQQLEQRAQGRVSLVKKANAEEERALVNLTPAEKQLILTTSEQLLIERLQGIAAVAYNALLRSHNTADPFQTDKKGISLSEIHSDLQELWVTGAAASLTFGKQQDLRVHRSLYRLMPLKMRLEYENILKRYLQAGAAPKAKHLLQNVLPQVPLPNGNRGSFRLRQEQWQAVVKSLVEPCDPQYIPTHASGVLMSWVESNKVYHGILKQEFAKQLLDTRGQFRAEKKLPDGRRSVIPLKNKEGHIIVYPKAYPELPGRQIAADCLAYRITGSAAQTSLVLFTPLQKGIINEKVAYPVLLSKPAGKTIQHYARKKDVLETRKLDSYHFTLKVLATYIIGYEDDKKDNVTLIKTLDSMGHLCWQLVSIDNDHAFFPPMVNTNVSSKVQVKTVTFTFPAMKEPLDSEAIADFLSLNKQLVLQEWLGECHTLSSGFLGNLTITPPRQGLFKPEVIQRLAPIDKWFTSEQFSFIPIAFEPGTISDLYQRWLRVERVLERSLPLTHFELLQQLSPRLAQAYKKIFQEHNTVMKRFDTLAELHTDYKVTKNAEQITHTSSHQVNISKTLVGVRRFQDALLQGKIFDASGKYGLQELDGVQTHYQQLIRLKKLFDIGLDIDDNGQQAVIQTLKLLLSKPYYSALIERVLANARFYYTEKNTKRLTAFQDKLLKLLAQQSLQHLTLVGWQALTEEKFLSLIEKSADLQSLTLIDCPNFSCSALTWARLSVKCPHLEKIRLSKVSELTLSQWVNTLELPKPVKFNKLQSLHLENCPDLLLYQINAPKIQKLTLKNCQKLTQLNLSGQPLSVVRLQACEALFDAGIVHDNYGQHLRTVTVRNCKNLKFITIYQAWPLLLGQLGIGCIASINEEQRKHLREFYHILLMEIRQLMVNHHSGNDKGKEELSLILKLKWAVLEN